MENKKEDGIFTDKGGFTDFGMCCYVCLNTQLNSLDHKEVFRRVSITNINIEANHNNLLLHMRPQGNGINIK